MALQKTGQITMDNIRDELGVSGQTPFSLYDAVNGVYSTINTCSEVFPSTTPPYRLTDWYGYDHNAICCTCKYVTITIEQVDLDNANSNTDPSLDGKVFWYYNQCDDAGYTTVSWTTAGVDNSICACEENGTAGLYFWTNDTQTYTSNSTIAYGSNC